MTQIIPYDDAANKLYSYANVWYRWGGQSKEGIDCSGYVSEWWEDIGFKSEGFDATADRMFDNFRNGVWKGTKLSKPEFGCLVFYGPNADEEGTNAGHVVVGLSSKYIIGANGGSKSTTTVAIAKSRYAFVKVQAVDYRKDMLAIWMPDYSFDRGVVTPPTPAAKKYVTTANVNLRATPSISAAVVTVIPNESNVIGTSQPNVSDGTYTWVNIISGANVGWSSDKYLELL